MVIIKLYKRKYPEKIDVIKSKFRELKFEFMGINNLILINKKRFWAYYKKLWTKCKRCWMNKFIHCFWVSFV